MQETEAKRTELRLVLASWHRELVGGSDEVLRMKERAKELHDFVHALPDLLRKLELQPQQQGGIGKEESKEDLVAVTATTTIDIPKTRRQLSELTRCVHRALDQNHFHLLIVRRCCRLQ